MRASAKSTGYDRENDPGHIPYRCLLVMHITDKTEVATTSTGADRHPLLYHTYAPENEEPAYG